MKKEREFVLDVPSHTFKYKDRDIHLPNKEFQLIEAMANARGVVLSREDLLRKIWGIDESMRVDSRTIDQHIARIRTKLTPLVASKLFKTVHGYGYKVFHENIEFARPERRLVGRVRDLKRKHGKQSWVDLTMRVEGTTLEKCEAGNEFVLEAR